MIFKIKLEDRTEFAQAKDGADLISQYELEYGEVLNAENITEISEKEAKTIMLANNEYDESDPEDLSEFSLFDTVTGTDFCIVGSTEWL